MELSREARIAVVSLSLWEAGYVRARAMMRNIIQRAPRVLRKSDIRGMEPV